MNYKRFSHLHSRLINLLNEQDDLFVRERIKKILVGLDNHLGEKYEFSCPIRLSASTLENLYQKYPNFEQSEVKNLLFITQTIKDLQEVLQGDVEYQQALQIFSSNEVN